MGLELERQYVAQGRYGADITTEVEELREIESMSRSSLKKGKVPPFGTLIS